MPRLHSLFLPALLITLAGCATKSLEPTSVAPRYKRMHTAPVPSVNTCAALARVVVEDARIRQDLGTRTLEEKPEMSQPIRWSGDLPGWVRAGAEDALKRSGATTDGASNKPTLRLKVERLEMSENVLRRSTFSGRVGLKAELVAAGATQACFRTDVSGTASNYGYSGSPENYEETLNHALDRAMEQLLLNADFSTRLCSCASPK